MEYKQFLGNEYITVQGAAGNDNAAGKLYDLSMLYEMDDDEYVAQILTIFLKDTPKQLKEMKEAAVAKKIDIVNSRAHGLKSSTGIINANKLSRILEQIEEISVPGKPINDLSEVIGKAEIEYNKIQSSLQAVLKALS